MVSFSENPQFKNNPSQQKKAQKTQKNSMTYAYDLGHLGFFCCVYRNSFRSKLRWGRAGHRINRNLNFDGNLSALYF